MKSFLKALLKLSLSTSLLISATGCDGWFFEEKAYGGVSIEGEPIRLLVLQKPVTYQHFREIERGLEFEILQQFALDSGLRLKVQTVRNEKALLKLLAAGRGDLAAGRFSSQSDSQSRFFHSQAYDDDKTSLVCRKSVDLEHRYKLVLNTGTSDYLKARQLKKENPQMRVVSRPSLTPAPILHLLERGKGDCTIMDRLEAQHYLRVYPTLEIAKDVSDFHPFFFLISKSRKDVALKLEKWLSKSSRRRFIFQAKNQFRNAPLNLSKADIRGFVRARNRIFPRYSGVFRKHSDSFGIPWQLAAAVAYQESKWDPEALSFTGVRGLMQLTEETAEHLGVQDRTDVNQSVWGGVKYLRMLLDRQPKGLLFRDKLALALATYNVGPAHMLDAQRLAQKMGKNPYSWKDLQEILPLLADKDYLSELKYGPARGQEPVDYVHKVFAYLDLISVQI